MVYEYDIAISFAGEDRMTAERIAFKLKGNGVKVFYDKYEEADLFGEDLYERLHDVYGKKARFCIMLISKYYAEKAWTRHERKSAQERALGESKPYILPVRLDNTPIPGLRETILYFDLQTRPIEELISIVMQKVGDKLELATPSTHPSNSSFSIPLPKTKLVFSERDKDRFYEESFATIKKYFQQGIVELNKLNNVEGDFVEITSQRFSCKIYSLGNRISACTVWLGSSFSRESGISYSNQANQDSSNSMNEILNIEVNDNALTFKALMNMFSSKKSSKLSPIEAAEYLWNKLIEPLNR